VDSVLDADPHIGNAYVWALGIDTEEMPGAEDPAEVMNNSGGSEALADDNMYLQSVDVYTSAFGTSIALPAGNDGLTGGRVADPCIAYNSLCMGAYRHLGTADPADDVIADFSSRGPSPSGRKKPDLVGIGVTQYAERRWWVNGLWDGRMEGTSFASPQGAGAAALLAGSGISDPNAQKAILINSARQGRATPTDPMGSQTGWQPDWGWGALDLNAALGERTNFAASEVPGGSARFFRASNVQPTDRTTLVWYRRAWIACHTGDCMPQPMTLTNLDLQQLDPSTGAVQTQSASSIDNVEQVRSPGANTTTIYKVKATSTVDGLAAEPFALAGRRPLTALATPQPAVTVDVDATTQTPGQTATVTATVRNPSADLTAENAHLTLRLPDGVELTSGAATRDLGTLATSSPTTTHSWTVRGTADGVKKITAAATASRYGETFTGTATDSYTVDGTGPTTTIAAPGGRTTSRPLAISWGGADDLGSVAHYDVDVASDGGAFVPWHSATTATTSIYDAAVGHSYRFRVRATDTLGNRGGYTESATTEVVDRPPTATGTTTTAPPGTTKRDARLTLTRIKRGRSTIAIAATTDRYATGRVTVTFTCRAGGKRFTVKATERIRHGTVALALKLPRSARKTKTGVLTLSYGGDHFYAAQTLRRSIASR
jgi:uncharacterized repeat protein (TIGR01451 family)